MNQHEQKDHHLSSSVDLEAEILTLETYFARLRPKDRDGLCNVILPLLDQSLPQVTRLFIVGSSWKKKDYRDIDIVIGAEHEEVAGIAALCHEVLESEPRITFQDTTRNRDPEFSSPLPIGFGITIDSKRKVITKEDARGMFDFAVPRYNYWEILYNNRRGILIR